MLSISSVRSGLLISQVAPDGAVLRLIYFFYEQFVPMGQF